MNPPSRYCDRALPSRPYTPGLADPGPRPEHYAALTPAWNGDPSNWRAGADYLYGIDLLNAGYPWEAHEALEVAWKQIPADQPARNVVRAVIQVSAALVKRRAGNRIGVERLFSRAMENLRPWAGRRMMGIDVDSFTRQARLALREGAENRPLIMLGEP